MKNFTLFVILSVFLLFNCSTGPVNGLLFSKTTFAGEANLSPDSIPPLITAEGCQYSFLGLVAFGTAGAGDIANTIGIKRISSINHSSTSFLQVVYHSYCTVVTGAGY